MRFAVQVSLMFKCLLELLCSCVQQKQGHAMKLRVLLLVAVAGAATQPRRLNQYESLREFFFRLLRGTEGPRELTLLTQRGKLQRRVPPDQPFPCATEGQRSPQRPASVHELRPGDVDVVAAMGDSLSAGNGNRALTPFHVSNDYRGNSFSGGGAGTWRDTLTLPNILKEFNPALIGYSTQTSLGHHRASQFLVAEGTATSVDLRLQVRLLYRRLRTDPRVDIANDWKLVTIMVGANDFCMKVCYLRDPFDSLEQRRQDLHDIFSYLKANLPRTFVNFILSPSMEVVTQFTQRPLKCELLVIGECPCLFGMHRLRSREKLFHLMRQWQQVDREVASDPAYNTDDFAVVLQPFTQNLTFPVTPDNRTDFSYLSEDCFHFSQKMNARVANALWNNLLEPVGNKSTNWRPVFERFLCPSPGRPYLSTSRNSNV